jgi:hypothetical protein
MAEVASSRLAVRSMNPISGVPVHKHWAGLVCMCIRVATLVCSEPSRRRRSSRADTADMEEIRLDSSVGRALS